MHILHCKGCTICILYQILFKFDAYFEGFLALVWIFKRHLSCTWSEYRKSKKLSIKCYISYFVFKHKLPYKREKKTLGVINIRRKTFITMVTYFLCHRFQKKSVHHNIKNSSSSKKLWHTSCWSFSNKTLFLITFLFLHRCDWYQSIYMSNTMYVYKIEYLVCFNGNEILIYHDV